MRQGFSVSALLCAGPALAANSVAQDGSCANRTSGTSHYQVPERGSANDGSALSLTCQIVLLPSPSSRLGRDWGAFSLEYCICLVELVPLPQPLQPAGIIPQPPLFTCPLLRVVSPILS